MEAGSRMRRGRWAFVLAVLMLPGIAPAGAVDGVKDGKYAFHAARERNPWWQVDLEAVVPIERVVVFNRLDYAPGLHNADHLNLLTSDDGRAWMLATRTRAGTSGGSAGPSPWKSSSRRARFVRL